MAFQWRLLLVLSALVLGGGPLFAASAREDRAYAAAGAAFHDGIWDRAETDLLQFIRKYPNSTNVPEAVLLLAQAEFKQGKFTNAIARLTNINNLAKARTLADRYVYWIGEARFANSDFSGAAETFTKLAQNYPDSSLRLRAEVEAASAYAHLGQWLQVDAVLEETNGVFRRAAQMDPAGELVSRGRLLLAQSKFEQQDFAGASAVLESLNPQTLKPELDWQRTYLLYRVRLAGGDMDAALAATTNLIQLSASGGLDDLRAESVALQADLWERLGQATSAITVYRENLTNAPIERQRQAVLKIAELAMAQNQFPEAEQSLEGFLTQFTNSPLASLALLTLGELHLKNYLASPAAAAATNHLLEAQARFDQFLVTFTNSPLAGKAYLDRGWCLWLGGRFADSLEAFKAAAQRLPPSEDLAVARFKMGDVLFAQTNYAGALTNYHVVLAGFTNLPAVSRMLGDRALYQSLRANLELRDAAGASQVMSQILELYPASPLAQKSVLLIGEDLADTRHPPKARALFEKFEETFPDSPLRPPVELAIARTYEQERNWSAAISQYDRWLERYATHALRPQADYARARANFQVGDETNAFLLFTNFVAQFPTNDLAPLAQWWVAEHFFRVGDYVEAEKNYQLVFQTWPASELAYQARMMAGRAAMARLGYSDAIRYFTNLTSDANCPTNLNAQALFAYGSALMRMDSANTNRPLANFEEAIRVFKTICRSYPTNEPCALAWGGIGNCELQLAAQDPHAYDLATNAYAQVVNSPYASVPARNEAQVGIGLVFEKRAALATDDDRTALLRLALQNYLDVLYRNKAPDGGQADAFWTKKAGLKAADLLETLGEWEQARNVYQRLEELLPSLKDSLEKKIARAQEHLPPGEK
jgi:TolA-binding protein